MQIEINDRTWLQVNDQGFSIEQDHLDHSPINFVQLTKADAIMLIAKMEALLEEE